MGGSIGRPVGRLVVRWRLWLTNPRSGTLINKWSAGGDRSVGRSVSRSVAATMVDVSPGESFGLVDGRSVRRRQPWVATPPGRGLVGR